MFDMNKLIKQFEEIPFGNSDYQNVQFVLNAQLTPERAYRALGLRLLDRLKALQSAQFSIKKMQIDIEEKEWKIENDTNLTQFDIRRIKIELEEIEASRAYSEKLAKDAVHECNLLYAELSKFPEYTRVQFENAESTHYEIKMLRQIQVKDENLNTLLNTTIDRNLITTAIERQKELGVDVEINQRKQMATNASLGFLGSSGILKLEEKIDE